MRHQTANNQATNSPSKIEGAGGEYDVLGTYFLIFESSLVFILPLTPSILEGELTFKT